LKQIGDHLVPGGVCSRKTKPGGQCSEPVTGGAARSGRILFVMVSAVLARRESQVSVFAGQVDNFSD
jgi:hypothetical protein